MDTRRYRRSTYFLMSNRESRCRSLIAGENASSFSEVLGIPAGSAVLSAVGAWPPHVGVQDAGVPM
jgi:hypothetical protein